MGSAARKTWSECSTRTRTARRGADPVLARGPQARYTPCPLAPQAPQHRAPRAPRLRRRGAPSTTIEVDHVKRLLAAVLSALAIAAAGLAGPAAAQTSTRAPATVTLAKIKATKQINVAVSADSFPLSFIKDNKGDPVGYSIDLCKKVIAQVSRATGVPDLKVTWIPGTVAERIAMVASGKADIDCANTTATLTRMQDVDFSSLIFLETGGILVKDAGPVKSFADFAGRSVAVISGTTTE